MNLYKTQNTLQTDFNVTVGLHHIPGRLPGQEELLVLAGPQQRAPLYDGGCCIVGEVV